MSAKKAMELVWSSATESDEEMSPPELVGLVSVAASVEVMVASDWSGPVSATAPASVLDESIVCGVDADATAPKTSAGALGTSVVEGVEMSATVLVIGAAGASSLVDVTVVAAAGGALEVVGSGALELRKWRSPLDTRPEAGAHPSAELPLLCVSDEAGVVDVVGTSDPVNGVSDAGAVGVTG